MLKTVKILIILQVSVFLTIGPVLAKKRQRIRRISSNPEGINLKLFKRPFCMIGNGNYNQPRKKKLKTIRRYQRKISRKTKHFKKNRKKEKKATLHGSPKWVAIKWLRHRGYSWKHVNFAFLTMTLFAEAKNLDEKNMAMVAKVINNRKRSHSYIDTVTKLAQFSSWYYKNQRDNIVLLCPHKKYHKYWKKSVRVAAKYFNQETPYFRATHYFAPRNMVPRYKVPLWAKGRYAVGHGGHIFIVSKNHRPRDPLKKVVYIPRKAKRIRVIRGKIYL